MRIDWAKLSAISGIVSSIAILSTLVYVAIQVRQNTAETQAGARQALFGNAQQELLLLANDPELFLSFTKPHLTDQEQIRLYFFLEQTFRMREHEWLQYRNGVLEEATLTSYTSPIPGFLQFRRARDWWVSRTTSGAAFQPGFVRFVNEQIADLPVSDELPVLFDEQNVLSERLGNAIREVGFACGGDVRSQAIDADGNVWRVACGSTDVYAASLEASGEVCIEPVPFADAPVGLAPVPVQPSPSVPLPAEQPPQTLAQSGLQRCTSEFGL